MHSQFLNFMSFNSIHRVWRWLQTVYMEISIGQLQMPLCKMVVIGWKKSQEPYWGFNLTFHLCIFLEECFRICIIVPYASVNVGTFVVYLPVQVGFGNYHYGIAWIQLDSLSMSIVVACIWYVIEVYTSNGVTFSNRSQGKK